MPLRSNLMRPLRDSVHRRVLDSENPRSLAGRARARRWAMLLQTFPNFGAMRVLDLGGTTAAWLAAPQAPADVVVVNLWEEPAGGPVRRTILADACDLPEALRREHFDLVYSNSVIEHVGDRERRHQFAETVRASAPSYWVQTPYRYFPVEPHWLFPGFQFLPIRARVAVARRWPFGHRALGDDGSAALDQVLGVELLAKTEMARLFPDAAILCERFAGLVKSLIAVRRGA